MRPRSVEFRYARFVGYKCSEPGDQSGEYVRADVAARLLDALVGLLADYKEGAESGDWGTWDFEGQPVVKAARIAIADATAIHSPELNIYR